MNKLPPINISAWTNDNITIVNDDGQTTRTIPNPITKNLDTDIYLSQHDQAYMDMDLKSIANKLIKQKATINDLSNKIKKMITIADQSTAVQLEDNKQLVNVLNSIEVSALFDRILEHNNLAYKTLNMEESWAKTTPESYSM